MALAFKKAEPYFPKKRPPKEPAYLNWLHKLPCAVTGRHPVEAAHVSFASPWHGHYGRAKGTKAPDQFAVPLAPHMHASQHEVGEKKFWHEWQIDPHQLALTLWAIYSMYDEAEATERATARIYGGIAKAGDEITRLRAELAQARKALEMIAEQGIGRSRYVDGNCNFLTDGEIARAALITDTKEG